MMELSKLVTVFQILVFMIYQVSSEDKNSQTFIVAISSNGNSCPDNVTLAQARYNITQQVRRQLLDVDECQNRTLNNCDTILGVCTNAIDGFICTCPNGFGGDGIDMEQGGTGCYPLPQGCGVGNWRRVAYLNMTDNSQECPSNWQEYSNPSRACGPPSALSASCVSENFPSNGITYSRVCGKVIGYQSGTPDAYYASGLDDSINDPYVDGVSITHGPPLARQHIWTFSAHSAAVHCPCGGDVNGTPAFVGNHEYCGSESNQRIWDGVGCEISSCCNDQPWFIRDLGSSFADDIEIRICLDQTPANELVTIEKIEIYIE